MTTLTEPVLLVPAIAGGFVLGAAFQLALWWTVRWGLRANRSALWFPASLLLRLAVTVAGFWLVGAGHWQRLLACLAGFVLAQILVMRLVPGAAAPAPPGRSGDHAS